MTTKNKPSIYVSAALMFVVASSVAAMAALTNAEGGVYRSIVSYSNTSAYPYQPLNTPYMPTSRAVYEKSATVPVDIKPVLSPSVFNRKTKLLDRKITSVHKRLMIAEDKIEVLEQTIATMSGDTTGLQDSLLRLQKSRDNLSNQLAKLNTDLSQLKLQQ